MTATIVTTTTVATTTATTTVTAEPDFLFDFVLTTNDIPIKITYCHLIIVIIYYYYYYTTASCCKNLFVIITETLFKFSTIFPPFYLTLNQW